MLQNNKKAKEGFTIIEVLIVLAIAGLIMLIVFLAVPALQRNSRNTQRKNEVSNILGGVNEYMNNNNGKLPSTAAEQTAALQNTTLNFYSGNVTWSATTGAQTNNTTKDTAVIVKGAACGSTNDAVAGSARQLAILYTLENGGGTQKACTDS